MPFAPDLGATEVDASRQLQFSSSELAGPRALSEPANHKLVAPVIMRDRLST